MTAPIKLRSSYSRPDVAPAPIPAHLCRSGFAAVDADPERPKDAIATTPRSAFGRLTHISRCVDAIRALPCAPPDLLELAQLHALHISGDKSMDESFGLATSQGLKRANSSWRSARALHRAASSFKDYDVPAQIAQALSRYEVSGWRHERHLATNPHKVGTLRAEWWAVLKEEGSTPSAGTIRRRLELFRTSSEV